MFTDRLAAALHYIVPGAPWYDTDGNAIQAHGAGMLKVNETYYWFGEDKSGNTGLFKAVSVYTSTDLFTWMRLPDALSPIADTSISTSSVVERPKVVYNAANDEYVMWFHSDNQWYSAAEVGVATSKTPAGPYTYRKSFKPLGAQSRDEGVFVDDDDVAYLLYASDNNADFKIAEMTSDYRGIDSVTYVFTGQRLEAPGIIKRNGTYYLFGSELTGWWPNPNTVLSAPTIAGPWSAPQNLAPPATRTYFSQNAFDFVLSNTSSKSSSIGIGDAGLTSIYMGDRWHSNALGKSTYVWLPMTWVNGIVVLKWVDLWTIDLTTHAITTPTGKSYSASLGTLNGPSRLGSCSSCATGKMVMYIGAGGSVTIHNVTGTGTAQWVSLWYANGDWSWRSTSISVNGKPAVVVDQPDAGGSPHTFLSVPVRLMLDNSSSNEITIGANQTNYAADLDRIVVYPVG